MSEGLRSGIDGIATAIAAFVALGMRDIVCRPMKLTALVSFLFFASGGSCPRKLGNCL